MDSNKFFPKFLGESRLGTFYISPFFSLKTDNDIKTLWLDLKTKKGYFKKKRVSAYNYPIIRTSLGTSSDFSIFFNRKVKPLFEIFKEYPLPIPQIVQYILNPEILGQDHQPLIQQIQQHSQNFTDNDKKELIKFVNFIQGLPKKNIDILLDEGRYALVFGDLDLDKKFENNIATQTKLELKQQNISKEDVEKVFGHIVLDDKVFNNVFTSLGLQNICATPPKVPETGGAIFIDMGGTGKTLIKDALMTFWKRLGGTSIEKNGIAEFSKTDNYAALIGSWYNGYEGSQEGYDKDGLIKAADKNKVPSLLIIDEADRFISESKDGDKDKSAELIITELKRHLNKKTVGKVLTVFIANVDEKYLNSQLKQGGTRLTPVYFGPPTTQKDWLELISMYIKNSGLNFKNRDNNYDKLLADLILKHNTDMPHEKNMIVPRKFGPNFCNRYLNNYSNHNEDDIAYERKRFQRLHAMLHRNKKEEEVVINYNDFLRNFVDDLLLGEVKLAGLNIDFYRDKYYNFINLELEDEIDNNIDEKTKVKEELEKAEIRLILIDSDTKRIISAKYGFELLGVDSEEIRKNITNSWRLLNKKFNTQGGSQYKIGERYISSDLGKKLLEYINGKINVIDRDNIKVVVKDEYNWDEFYHYSNQQKN